MRFLGRYFTRDIGIDLGTANTLVLLVSRETGIPVFLSDNPLDCVALGAGKALAVINLLRRVAVSPRKRF